MRAGRIEPERQAASGALPGALHAGDTALGLMALFDGAISRRFASPGTAQPALDGVIRRLALSLLRPS